MAKAILPYTCMSQLKQPYAVMTHYSSVYKATKNSFILNISSYEFTIIPNSAVIYFSPGPSSIRVRSHFLYSQLVSSKLPR